MAARNRSRNAARCRAAGDARGRRGRLGTSVGSAWRRNRYHGPYQRDLLLDRGAMVETLETSHTWSRHGELYRAVGDAIRGALAEQGTPGFVFCHLSHAYADGASLYFTFIARAKKDTPARPVARGEDRRLRGDRRDGRDDHPPPRGRPRPRPLHAGRGGRPRPRCDRRRQGAARPGRDHEPRQAASESSPLRRSSGPRRGRRCRPEHGLADETRGGAAGRRCAPPRPRPRTHPRW